MPLDLLRLLIDIEAGHRGLSRRRTAQTAQHTHGRGLSGTVRSQEAEDLPSPDAERDVIHRPKITKRLHQMLDLNHQIHLGLHSGMVQGFRAEDMREALQDLLRCADSADLSFVQESNPVALPHLV